jgi:hypothetical protein
MGRLEAVSQTVSKRTAASDPLSPSEKQERNANNGRHDKTRVEAEKGKWEIT